MHRFIPLAVALATMFVAVPAQAVPLAFTHQARLLDGSGSPLVGAHQVRFSVYPSASGGSALWTEQATVQFDNGMMSHVLGSVTPLVLEDFDTNSLYLGIAVDSSPELAPRVPLASVPFAFRAANADTATNVSGGVVDASEIRINGSVVLDGSGAVLGDVSFNDLTDVPADLADGDDDALADLSCSSGQIPRFSSGSWACADADDHQHSAEDITSGTLSIDRIPVGSTSSTVAAGDHVHSFGQITGELPLSRTNGSLDVGRLTGDLPLSQTSGNLDIARTTGDIPANRLPDKLEAIANLNCTNGQVAKYNGSTWECGNAGGGGGTLLLSFEFDENSGFAFTDGSGLGNNGTGANSGAGMSSGSTGHSVRGVNFSGGRITVAQGNTVPHSPYVTLEAWVQPQLPLNATRTIAQREGVWALSQVNDAIRFSLTTANGDCNVTSIQKVRGGEWAHIGGAYNGREIFVSVDGAEYSASCTKGPLVQNPGSAHHIGGSASGSSTVNPYLGIIDEVRAWSVAPPIWTGYRDTYTQWGRTSCTTGETLWAGLAYTGHYSHSGSGGVECLENMDLGPTISNTGWHGDLLYGVSINHMMTGNQVAGTGLNCAKCAAPRGSCFTRLGSNSCPTGYNLQYSGTSFGSYYTHAGPMERICVDNQNFQNSGRSAPGAYLYNTAMWGPISGTSHATYDVVNCAVCCGG